MAWDKDDLETVEDAIRALAAGQREVSITISGPSGDRTQVFSNTTLKELQELRDTIRTEVNATSATSSTTRRPPAYRFSYNKGL